MIVAIIIIMIILKFRTIDCVMPNKNNYAIIMNIIIILFT